MNQNSCIYIDPTIQRPDEAYTVSVTECFHRAVGPLPLSPAWDEAIRRENAGRVSMELAVQDGPPKDRRLRGVSEGKPILSCELGPSGVSPNQRSRWKKCLLAAKTCLTYAFVTSNGSWCMGIKGEMSGTVCVTFTWYMYIYGLFIAFVSFVVCSLF